MFTELIKKKEKKKLPMFPLLNGEATYTNNTFTPIKCHPNCDLEEYSRHLWKLVCHSAGRREEEFHAKIEIIVGLYCECKENTKNIGEIQEKIERIIKLEIERNKTLQDKNVVDINNLLSRIEKQEEQNNKQTEMINVLTTSIETKEENIKNMIICNRIVFGVLIILYITFEIYKNYNFEFREDVCQVKQITYN